MSIEDVANFVGELGGLMSDCDNKMTALEKQVARYESALQEIKDKDIGQWDHDSVQQKMADIADSALSTKDGE